MKNYALKTILASITIAFVSCASNENFASEDRMVYAEAKQAIAATEETYSDGANVETDDISSSSETLREPILLIRNGRISFETKDMAKTVVRLRNINRQFGVTLFSENQHENEYSRTADFSLGINPKKFDLYIDSLDAIAVKYDRKDLSGEDVTEEVVDIRSRIKTKKTVLARYTALLEKADNINDILRLEREIGSIQEEIESTEARLLSIMNKVNLSKLEISVYQELKPMHEDTFKEDASDAFDGGARGVKNIIVVLIYLWPLWIISAIILTWLGFKMKKWKQNKKK